MTNNKTGKIRIFEGTNVSKLELWKEKNIENLKISDNINFTVNNHTIKIDSLFSIKRQPKVLGTVKTVVFVTGLTVIG